MINHSFLITPWLRESWLKIHDHFDVQLLAHDLATSTGLWEKLAEICRAKISGANWARVEQPHHFVV
jgi:hypothetical protein